MRPYFDTSMGRDRMVDERSATTGMPTSGTNSNSTPWMVSLGVMCR
jgi:hypothetical protein